MTVPDVSCDDHTFPEEHEPSGRLILAPCLSCGMSAMDAMDALRVRLETITFACVVMRRALILAEESIAKLVPQAVYDPDERRELNSDYHALVVVRRVLQHDCGHDLFNAARRACKFVSGIVASGHGEDCTLHGDGLWHCECLVEEAELILAHLRKNGLET